MGSSCLSLTLPAWLTMRMLVRYWRTGSDHTFMGRLWVRCKWDVIQLSQAEPFSIHRHSEFAKVDGLHGSLCDLVSGGGWHVGWRRQSRHDDSAGTTTHTHTHTPQTKINNPQIRSSATKLSRKEAGEGLKKKKKRRKNTYALSTKCSR